MTFSCIITKAVIKKRGEINKACNKFKRRPFVYIVKLGQNLYF